MQAGETVQIRMGEDARRISFKTTCYLLRLVMVTLSQSFYQQA